MRYFEIVSRNGKSKHTGFLKWLNIGNNRSIFYSEIYGGTEKRLQELETYKVAAKIVRDYAEIEKLRQETENMKTRND